MNLVGKIFTVLIFLMCVVFGTFALMVHSAHKNWKTEAYDYNRQLTEANQQKQEALEEQKNLQTALADEKARIQKRLIALQNQANIANAQRDAMEGDLRVKTDDARKLALAIEAANKNLSVLQEQIDRMRNENKVTLDQRNTFQKELVKAQDDLQNAVVEKQKLEKLQRQLAEQIVKLKELLAYAKVTPNEMLKSAPADLEGEVTSVPRPDVVEISVGADDGVRKGHRFVVTRPSTGKYIGIIQVIQVDYGNRAVCRPDKATQSDQIQKGDHVKADNKPR